MDHVYKEPSRILIILFFMLIPFFGFLRKLSLREGEDVVSGRREGYREPVLSPSLSHTFPQAHWLSTGSASI